MKKKLYLMRHGQTLFNERKKIQGSCDSPLTELGKKQARIAGLYFKENGITFDHAYSSTQERASDTLEIVTDSNMPYTRLKGIKEWNFGLFEGEPEYLNPKPAPGKRTYGDFFVASGGEGDTDVQKRMSQTLIKIMERDDHKNVLAVSHGGSCYMFFLQWAGDYPHNGHSQNCTIFEYEFENGQFTLINVIDHDFDKEV